MFINTHTHHELRDAEIEIVNIDPGSPEKPLYFSRGIHPWHVNEFTLEEELREVEKSGADKKCLAIGECGLDRLGKAPLELQQKAFMLQVVLANRLNKPIIVHCVKAFNELLNCLNHAGNSMPVIIHGFNNNESTASLLLNEGCYFSFGKALMGYQSPAAKAIRSAGRRRIFLETDDADIPIRGVYNKAAELLGVQPEIVEAQLQNNFEEVFKRKL